MYEITAYKCADGSLFEDEDKAKAHDDDLLGQELDGLLKMFELDITRTQEYKALLIIMKKKASLRDSLQSILHILEHTPC